MGRFTEVSIELTAPVVEPQASRLRAHLIYDVKEGRRDYTHLQMSRDILMPLPNNWTQVAVLGAGNFGTDMVIYGKNHRWNSVDVNAVNWIQMFEAKIDGPGDDIDGNAGVRINFAISLEYQLA
jgi:hypothetical protein